MADAKSVRNLSAIRISVKFIRSLLILSAKSLFDQKSSLKTISKRFEFPGPWAAHEFFKFESLVFILLTLYNNNNNFTPPPRY